MIRPGETAANKARPVVVRRGRAASTRRGAPGCSATSPPRPRAGRGRTPSEPPGPSRATGVHRVEPRAPAAVRDALARRDRALRPAAVKIGMAVGPGDGGGAARGAGGLRRARWCRSGAGDVARRRAVGRATPAELLPLLRRATLVTPNAPEAGALAGAPGGDRRRRPRRRARFLVDAPALGGRAGQGRPPRRGRAGRDRRAGHRGGRRTGSPARASPGRARAAPAARSRPRSPSSSGAGRGAGGGVEAATRWLARAHRRGRRRGRRAASCAIAASARSRARPRAAASACAWSAAGPSGCCGSLLRTNACPETTLLAQMRRRPARSCARRPRRRP